MPVRLALAGSAWLLIGLIVVPWLAGIGWFLALSCNLWLSGVASYIVWNVARAADGPVV